jgi:ankyrin repeat protein
VSDICDEKVLYILDEENEEENSLIDQIREEDEADAGGHQDDVEDVDDVFLANNNLVLQQEMASSASVAENNNVVIAPPPEPEQPERTTEGILKAARLGDLIILSELHQAGYSLLSLDETGKTALHYGTRFGHKDVLRFLIAKAPARILDMVDLEKGQTALHKAAGYKRRTICCMLVAAGASLLIKEQYSLRKLIIAFDISPSNRSLILLYSFF